MPRVDAFAVAILVWTLLIAPILAWLGAKRIASAKPLRPKLQRLQIDTVLLSVIAIVAAIAARTNGIVLGLHFDSPLVLIAATFAGVLVVAAALGQKRATPERLARAYELHWPENSAQYRWKIAVSLAAGIGEEIVYRAVLYALVLRTTSSVPIAFAVSVAAFALAHMTYGRTAVFAVAYIGAVFQLIYVLTGNLLLTIVIHTLYDLGVNTVAYYRLQRGDFATVLQDNTAPATQAAETMAGAARQ